MPGTGQIAATGTAQDLIDSARMLPMLPPTVTGIPAGNGHGHAHGNGNGHGSGAGTAVEPAQHG